MIDRMMAVLGCGYVKVEKIEGRTMAYVPHGMWSDDIMSLRLDDEGVEVFTIDGSDGFDLGYKGSGLSHLEVLVATRDGKMIASGSNDGIIDERCLLDSIEEYIDTKYQNGDTYDGVTLHSNSLMDSINDINIEDIKMPLEDIASEDTVSHDEVVEEIPPSDIEEKIDNYKPCYDDNHPFYKEIEGQLDDLFSRYERENTLESVISGSQFAKIYYEEDKYYVIGKICEDDVPILICYGYPGRGDGKVPSGVEGSYDFVPLDRDDMQGEGYYMMYQNAKNGEVIAN